MDSNDAPSGAACAPPSDEEPTKEHSRRPSLTVKPPQAASGIATGTVLISPTPASADRGENEQHRRQRRRMDTDSASANRPSPHTNSPSTASASARSQSPSQYAYPQPHPALLSKASQHSLRGSAHSRSPEGRLADAEDESDDDDGASGEDELALAVGQLSINEDQQVRYHGKASGLHLLDATQRDDGRSEGGIWYVAQFELRRLPLMMSVTRRFPKARVWPPLPATAGTPTKGEDDWAACLPPLNVQEHLLELYFTYVHTQLPILHKTSFMEIFRTGSVRIVSSAVIMSDLPDQ